MAAQTPGAGRRGTHKAFRFRLYPNPEQQAYFARQFGGVRFVYNHFLRQWMDDPGGESLAYEATIGRLQAMQHSADFAWLRGVSAPALHHSLRELADAYHSTLAHQTPLLRLKRKHDHQSFHVPQGFYLTAKHLILPGVAPLRIVIHRPLEGVMEHVTVSKTKSGRYYASIHCAVQDVAESAGHSPSGRAAPLPSLHQAEKRLKRLQRRLSRRQPGSKGQGKERQRLARQYVKVANHRLAHQRPRQQGAENQTPPVVRSPIRGPVRPATQGNDHAVKFGSPWSTAGTAGIDAGGEAGNRPTTIGHRATSVKPEAAYRAAVHPPLLSSLKENKMHRNKILGTVMFLSLLALGGWLLRLPSQLSSETTLARAAQADRAGLTDAARDRFVNEVGEDESNETAALLEMEDYWHDRVTYPTGEFDRRWVDAAVQQDLAIARAVPAGRVIYDATRVESSLVLTPSAFTFLGPKPLQSNGCINCFQYGRVAGRTNDILIDPTNPAIVYVASDGGGVWKTTNCCDITGTTWMPVTDDPALQGIAIGTLEMDPNNPATIYAGTGDLRFGSTSFGSSGLLKSTNGGTTWQIKGADVFAPPYPLPVGQFPQYQAIGKVEVDPNNSNNIVVGTKTGLFFSYNGGDNWSGPCITNNFPEQRQDITGLILHDAGTTTTMYAAVGTRGVSTTLQYDLYENGANGIYRANVPAAGCPAAGDWALLTRADNGWPAGTGQGIPANQPNSAPVGRIDIAIAPSNPLVMYAEVQSTRAYTPTATTAAYKLLGIWRTVDGGATWELRATDNDLTSSRGCNTDSGTQNWYNQDIKVDPNNPDVVWTDMIDVWRSTNGGDTFQNMTCGYDTAVDKDVHVDNHSLEYRPGSSTFLMASNDGGIYYTADATASEAAITFGQLNNTLPTIEWYSGDITANFATDTTPGINAGSQDNGSAVCAAPNCTPGPNAVWQVRRGGDGMFARIEPILEQRWYQESQNGSMGVTTAGPYGGQVNATGGWTADRRGFIFPYELYKFGDTSVANSGCTAASGCTRLIAGSYRVWETVTGGIPTSSWLVNSPDLTKGTLLDRSYINQLAYAFTTPTIAIAGTMDGNVQYGFNLGQGVANSATWVNVTGGNTVLPNRPILDVVTSMTATVGYAAVGGFDQNTPTTPGHVFQVTCDATCGTFTWANKSGNLPNIPVDSIMVNPRFPQQVFAGTDWGLYFTDNITVATPVWYRFQAGLPNAMIWDMSVDRGYTALAVFTRGRGAYAWPLPNGPLGGPVTSVTLNDLDSTPTTPILPLALGLLGVTLVAGTALALRRR